MVLAEYVYRLPAAARISSRVRATPGMAFHVAPSASRYEAQAARTAVLVEEEGVGDAVLAVLPASAAGAGHHPAGEAGAEARGADLVDQVGGVRGPPRLRGRRFGGQRHGRPGYGLRVACGT